MFNDELMFGANGSYASLIFFFLSHEKSFFSWISIKIYKVSFGFFYSGMVEILYLISKQNYSI